LFQQENQKNKHADSSEHEHSSEKDKNAGSSKFDCVNGHADCWDASLSNGASLGSSGQVSPSNDDKFADFPSNPDDEERVGSLQTIPLFALLSTSIFTCCFQPYIYIYRCVIVSIVSTRSFLYQKGSDKIYSLFKWHLLFLRW
jgi:hypothetical protein